MSFQTIKTQPITLKTGPLYSLLLCLVLFSSNAYSQIEEPITLQPLKAAFPLSPYTQVNDQGIPYGYAPALVSMVSERLGREIDVEVMPYLRTLHALKMGHIDIGFGLRVQGSSVYLPEGIVAASEPQLILPTSFYALPERNIRIDNIKQISHYRIGTVRLEAKEQRVLRTGQENAYYYKDAYSLSKALQAHHIDIATLEPGSAEKVTQELGLPLERLYDYNHLEIFPVFSNVSPRMENPLALCQNFVETRVEAVKDGSYAKLLIDSKMEHLGRYYNQIEILSGHCHITTPADQNPDSMKNTAP